MIYIFILTYLMLLLANKFLYKTYFNSFNIIFFPYVVISVVNNFFLKKIFYTISSDAFRVLIFAMIIYELGAVIFYSCYGKQYISSGAISSENNYFSDSVNVYFNIVKKFIVLVFIIRIVEILSVYRIGGLAAVALNDYEGLQTGVLVGRLVICTFPAGWMIAFKLFSHNTKNKKETVGCVILLLMVLLVQFLCDVKAHAMIFAVGCFFIACYFDKRNLLRGSLLLVGFVFIMFFANYAVNWFAEDGSTPSLEFTICHFWKYIASGTINMDGCINSGTTTYNFIDYWTSVLAAIPNEILHLFGKKITPTGRIPYIQAFPSISPVYRYETSNVVNLFGRFWGMGGINIIGFTINVIIFAFVSEWAIIKFKSNEFNAMNLVGTALLSYEFVSFFSVYYGTSHFWQILIYSVLFFWLTQKVKFKFGINRGVTL